MAEQPSDQRRRSRLENSTGGSGTTRPVKTRRASPRRAGGNTPVKFSRAYAPCGLTCRRSKKGAARAVVVDGGNEVDRIELTLAQQPTLKTREKGLRLVEPGVCGLVDYAIIMQLRQMINHGAESAALDEGLVTKDPTDARRDGLGAVEREQ